MASCVGSIIASAACCISGTACSCCCAACPNTTTSTATRVAYALLFATVTIIASAMTGAGATLMDMSEYTGVLKNCGPGTVTGSLLIACEQRWAELGVYRVCFGGAVFYLAMAIVMFGVKHSRDCRGSLQNGWWAIKLLLIAGLMTAAFFIDNDFFEEGWSYISIIGAAVFLLIQNLWLLETAHAWADRFKAGETTGCNKIVMLITTFGALIAVIAITVMLFDSHGHNAAGTQCKTNTFILTFNLLMVIIMVGSSLRSESKNKGLLQAAIVSFYSTYLIWSGLVSTAGILSIECANTSADAADANSTATTVIGVLFCLWTIMGVSKGGAKPSDNDIQYATADTERGRSESYTATVEGSLYHCALGFGCLYLTQVLTNWASARSAGVSEFATGNSETALWLQAVASWFAIGLYLWTILSYCLGPRWCPSRDWGSEA